ncbi:MAG TPA: hypothetical protein VE869_12275 [Gemmatimonas sp.]|nr:hypothetical protein [Gemmatimonas sp.]
MRLTTTVVVVSLSVSQSVSAQARPPMDTLTRLARIDSAHRDLGRRHGTTTWPGFRPDTIPTVFVLPGRGRALFGWPAGTRSPSGYESIPGHANAYWQRDTTLGAASTAVTVDGHPTAQVVARDLDPVALTATAQHEAFHAFAGVLRRDDRRFGTGENAFDVASYPIFDADNEALFALEGEALRAALVAQSPARRRALARHASAIRRTRHERLAPEFAEFDDASEMNEGLAQYAYHEALRHLAANGPVVWRREASVQLSEEQQRLGTITEDVTQSFRLRYYLTGAGMARLLDLLDGPAWKSTFLARNWTLQTALAHASGLDAPLRATMDTLRRASTFAAATSRTDARLRALRELRQIQADSVLRGPGLLLVLAADSLPSRDFNSCSFDPQNLLQVTPRIRIHTRWWRPCGGAGLNAEFNVPSVHDADAGTIRARIGDTDSVRISIGDAPRTLSRGETVLGAERIVVITPRVSMRVNRADIMRRGDTLLVRPRP